MTPQEAQEQLLKLMIEINKIKNIINCVDSDHKTSIKTKFIQLINKLEIKSDYRHFPGELFYFDGDKLILCYAEQMNEIRLRNCNYWNPIKKELGIDKYEFRTLILIIIAEIFSINKKPIIFFEWADHDIMSIEHHFQVKNILENGIQKKNFLSKLFGI